MTENKLTVALLLSYPVCIFVTWHDGYPVPLGLLELMCFSNDMITEVALGAGIFLAQVMLIASILTTSTLTKRMLNVFAIMVFIVGWIIFAIDNHQFGWKVTIISSLPFAFFVLMYFAHIFYFKRQSPK